MPLARVRSFASRFFTPDLRYARSTDDGNSNIDNNAFGAMFTLSLIHI